MNLVQKPLAAGQYVEDVFPKDLLVLHFTAGRTADGAIQSWAASPERVATAYVLDADGTVYQCFDPAKWAFHLGQKTTNANDKRSVAVEIANVGPLRKIGADLCWWPENFTKPYCKLTDAEKFIQLGAPWRGFSYFATFTEAQKVAIPELVTKICGDHGIPAKLSSMRDVADPSYFRNWKGIASHQNFRKDKFDVGPAFPWELVEAVCQPAAVPS